MFRTIQLTQTGSLFLPMSRRPEKGVWLIRIDRYSDEISTLIWQCHEAARTRGTVIEGRLGNPDERQLAFYQETMGPAFEASEAFIQQSLNRWTPRMSAANREEFAAALNARFTEMRAAGKTDGMLKNAYVKMMCWLHDKFERLTPFLEQDEPPMILYEGSGITGHELIFLRILSSMGADIVLLETGGDQAYQRLDPASEYSQLLTVPGGGPFPADYSLKKLRKEQAQKAAAAPERQATQQAAVPRPGAGPESGFPAPDRTLCTNAWMKKAELQSLLTPPAARGGDPSMFYPAFIRYAGANDRLTYPNELYQLYKSLQAANRKVCVVDGELPEPSPEEIAKIRRRNYRSAAEMIADLAGNIPSAASVELQRFMRQAFVRAMKNYARQEQNLHKLTVAAVYLLCWILRYQGQLFQGWKETDMPCFIKTGACRSAREALYPQYLSRLPVDVLILVPDLNQSCALQADNLLEITGSDSLQMTAFPTRNSVLTMQTGAHAAQGDLDAILRHGTGLYRNKQFARADVINLRTTYDEIFLLWNEELRYRPNFSADNLSVNIPVIYAKISGVEDGKLTSYWQKIRTVSGAPDTVLFRQPPFFRPGTGNHFTALAVRSVRDGKLTRDVIRNDRRYPFALLREEMQEHIFDKIQQMLDDRIIKGTFVNGMEYTVLSTVLGMSQELLRSIQGFDFTKKNPKLVALVTKDQPVLPEDAILLTFLNRIGFDVLLFVPTGYRTVERFLNGNLPDEHQIGDYMYDLTAPDFSAAQKGPAWLNLFVRKGN